MATHRIGVTALGLGLLVAGVLAAVNVAVATQSGTSLRKTTFNH